MNQDEAIQVNAEGVQNRPVRHQEEEKNLPVHGFLQPLMMGVLFGVAHQVTFYLLKKKWGW